MHFWYEGFIFKFRENIILKKIFDFTVAFFLNSLLGIELHGGSVGPSLTEYPLQLTMEDDNGGYVIVITGVVHLYVGIIHELWRVDYLTYRWTNMV